MPQDEQEATVTRKIRKHDGSVRWDEPAEVIERKVRAYYPWPASTFRILGKNGIQHIKITEARVAEGSGVSGTTLTCDNRWIVACGSGALEICKLIPEGSREMKASDFIRGLSQPGSIAKVLDGPPPPPPKL